MNIGPAKIFVGTTKTSPDEETTCILCGVTPASAKAANMKPATVPHPGFIQCDCHGIHPYSVVEAQLDAEAGLDFRTREIRDCFHEDSHRGQPRASASGGRSRKEQSQKREVRVEQDWAGYADPEAAQSVTVEKLTVLVKGKVPRAFRDHLETLSRSRQCPSSEILRSIVEKHVRSAQGDEKVPYGGDNVMVKVLMPKQLAILFDVCRERLGASRADMLAEVMRREWA